MSYAAESLEGLTFTLVHSLTTDITMVQTPGEPVAVFIVYRTPSGVIATCYMILM